MSHVRTGLSWPNDLAVRLRERCRTPASSGQSSTGLAPLTRRNDRIRGSAESKFRRTTSEQPTGAAVLKRYDILQITSPNYAGIIALGSDVTEPQLPDGQFRENDRLPIEGPVPDEIDIHAALIAFMRSVRPMWTARRQILVSKNIAKALEAAEFGLSVAEIFKKAGIALASPQKPKWRDGEKPEALRGLSAPRFMAEVHGRVIYKDVMRSIDAPLMKAVETYISKRTSRGLDLGDAEGLVLVATRPTRNRVPREARYHEKYGKQAKVIVQAMRETERAEREARARRQQHPEP
jgi:hypothetical protein